MFYEQKPKETIQKPKHINYKNTQAKKSRQQSILSLIIDYLGMNRYRLPIIMQTQLICRNHQRQYLLRPASASNLKYELPLFEIANQQTSMNVMVEHFRKEGVEIDLKGIVRIESGIEREQHNFMRIIYFGLTEASLPSGCMFRNITSVENNPSDISQSDLKLLKQIETAKHVYNFQLFREAFAQKAFKSSTEQTLISIA